MSAYPIALRGEEISALVVGGGRVATRKALALQAAGAQVRVIAPEVDPELAHRAEQGGITIQQRAYDRADLGDAHLVFAATDTRDVNARVATDATAERRLVNVADAGAEGTFATMAVHRAGALTIAVGADGVPGAAARVRDALAERFDMRYAAAVDELRQLRARILDRDGPEAWRAVAARVLGDDFCTLVERGDLDAELAAWR